MILLLNYTDRPLKNATFIHIPKKKAEQLFLLYVKECSYASNTLKTCPFKMNLTH